MRSAALVLASCVLLGVPGRVSAQEPAPQAAPAPAPFAGTFTAEALSLELSFADGRYSGTLRVGGQAYPVTAAPDGDGIKGTFDADGSSFEFTARLESDALVFTSDGTSHRLARPARANPLGRPTGGAGSKPADAPPPHAEGASPAPDPDLPQRFEHLVGVTVSVPRDWQVRQSDGSVLMVPPDAPRDESGPNEIYMLVYATSPSPSAQDAAAIEKITGELKGLNASFRVSGEAEKFDSPLGPAARLALAGTTDQGAKIQVVAEFAVRDGVAVGILGIGESRAISGRRAVARKIFNGLRPGTPKRDPQAAGTWRKSEGYSDANSGFSMATESTLRLEPSGRYTRSSRATGGDMSNSVDSTGGATRGRWYAGDGSFILLSDEGDTTQGSYKLIDGNLVVTPTGAKRQIWSR